MIKNNAVHRSLGWVGLFEQKGSRKQPACWCLTVLLCPCLIVSIIHLFHRALAYRLDSIRGLPRAYFFCFGSRLKTQNCLLSFSLSLASPVLLMFPYEHTRRTTTRPESTTTTRDHYGPPIWRGRTVLLCEANTADNGFKFAFANAAKFRPQPYCWQ